MLKMYNSVLDLYFLNNTIRAILYYYGIIQYLNLFNRVYKAVAIIFFLWLVNLFSILYGFM